MYDAPKDDDTASHFLCECLAYAGIWNRVFRTNLIRDIFQQKKISSIIKFVNLTLRLMGLLTLIFLFRNLQEQTQWGHIFVQVIVTFTALTFHSNLIWLRIFLPYSWLLFYLQLATFHYSIFRKEFPFSSAWFLRARAQRRW